MKRLSKCVILAMLLSMVLVGTSVFLDPSKSEASQNPSTYVSYYTFRFSKVPPKVYRGFQRYYYEFIPSRNYYLGWYR